MVNSIRDMTEISELTTEGFLQYLRAYQSIPGSTIRTKMEVKAAEPVKRLNATSSNFNRNNFLLALEKLIHSGSYGTLVSYHTDPKYVIHSLGLPHVNQRFLPWHRVFLRIFEMELNRVTGNSLNITVPYWDWESDSRIPDWILNYQVPKIEGVMRYDVPTPHKESITVERFVGIVSDPTVKMPTKTDVEVVMKNDKFDHFTNDLEYNIHNPVHRYVGGEPPGREPGTMALFISPADPIFWLHHCNIDRIWHRWQVLPENLDKNPNLPEGETGQRSPIMKPWPFVEKDTRKIEEGPLLGYSYDVVN